MTEGVTDLAELYDSNFRDMILAELGDETLERVDWVTVEDVNLDWGACRVSFLGNDAGWVKFGLGIPGIGDRVAMHTTFHGDKWIKIIAEPWRKVWTTSHAPITAADGYPYVSVGGLSTPLTAYAGRDYGIIEHGILPIDSSDNAFRYGLAAPGVPPSYPPATIDQISVPSTNDRIDKLIVDNTGLVYWVEGVEAVEPVAPATPPDGYEAGRVYVTPTATVVLDPTSDPAQARVMTDLRRDDLDVSKYRAESFNEVGAKFNELDFDGLMRRPSIGGQLQIVPPNIYGDGRDGAKTIPNATVVNLNASDAPYTNCTTWEMDFASGQMKLGPNPGVGVGDIVAAYIPRVKLAGSLADAGMLFISRVERISSGLLYCSPGAPAVAPGALSQAFAFIMRVPQYSALNVIGTLTCDPWDEAAPAPGICVIKCNGSIGGVGAIEMQGAGCNGGHAQTPPPCQTTGSVWEGQGLKDKIPTTIGDGEGLYGGGWGGQPEFCPFVYNPPDQGGGGAGGGGGSVSGNGGSNGAHPVGLSNYHVTAPGAPGGAPKSADMVTNMWGSAGHLPIGGGGGAGPGDGTHFNGSGPGAKGGGACAIFGRNVAQRINCAGSPGYRASFAMSVGSGGGGGGSVYVVAEIANNPTCDVGGSAGGIMWHDAFHDDGAGGRGGDGSVIVFYDVLNVGSFNGTVTLITPINFKTNGDWLSDPINLERPGSITSLRASWGLDASDNIPPQFYIVGASDSRFTMDLVRYPPGGDFFQEDQDPFVLPTPTYLIHNNVQASVLGVVTGIRQYWRVGAKLDTGSAQNPGDYPVIFEIEVSGVH